MENDNTVSKYDRTRGQLQGFPVTKPTTLKAVEDVTGISETFIVETFRQPDRGDTIFIECVDNCGTVTRLALPPRVANAIARQRQALTAKLRSRAAKQLAQERMERGEVPGFMRGKA